jgi:hypothetical protein
MEVGVADLFGVHGPIAQAGDAVYTPDWCVADMVRYFQPTGRILEPCKGGGAFLRHLPPETFWCEIREGRDFFAWSEHVDWIITNPPYSIGREFLRHALSVSDNVVFLLPARNIFSGYGTLREAAGWGGIAATLKEAVDIVYRGKIAVSTLRLLADRGNVQIFKVGRRWFTTLRSVREMKDRCPGNQKALASISTESAANGLSEMDRVSSALVALSQTTRALKRPSNSTSPASTSPPPSRRQRSRMSC